MALSIVVDENVPYAAETFGQLGSVSLYPGRSISAAQVRDADVLIVRSVTRVDRGLLEGAAVKFVGTATIGFDHVDRGYLDAQGIDFVSAPGSNANSVSEYITAALLSMAARQGGRLEGKTLGVVGVGNVGSRVVGKAEALGLRCLLNDPPKQRETGDSKYVPLDAVLAESDIVTLHVPLLKEGPDRTLGMADEGFFARMRPQAWFLNSSRGRVVDEAALARALDSGRIALTALDVWQGEPDIDPATVARVFLGTPHIAGYSFDGKVAATVMLYEALCRQLGQAPEVGLADLLPKPPVPEIDLQTGPADDEEALRVAIRRIYDIAKDDRDLRQAMQAGERRGVEFDRLRKNYPKRREFQNTRILLASSRDLEKKARGLGFQVESA
jgi:erythronate-4-phosphate dehydrogenase